MTKGARLRALVVFVAVFGGGCGASAQGDPVAVAPDAVDKGAADVSTLSDACRDVILRLRDQEGLAHHYTVEVNRITLLAQGGARREACERTLEAMREYDGMRRTLLQCRDEVTTRTSMTADHVMAAAEGVSKLAQGFGDLGRVAGCTGGR